MSVTEEIYKVQRELIDFTIDSKSESELSIQVKKLKQQYNGINIDLALHELIEKKIITYNYPSINSECVYASAL